MRGHGQRDQNPASGRLDDGCTEGRERLPPPTSSECGQDRGPSAFRRKVRTDLHSYCDVNEDRMLRGPHPVRNLPKLPRARRILHDRPPLDETRKAFPSVNDERKPLLFFGRHGATFSGGLPYRLQPVLDLSSDNFLSDESFPGGRSVGSWKQRPQDSLARTVRARMSRWKRI